MRDGEDEVGVPLAVLYVPGGGGYHEDKMKNVYGHNKSLVSTALAEPQPQAKTQPKLGRPSPRRG